MKLELLTIATVVDNAIRFVSEKSIIQTRYPHSFDMPIIVSIPC
jgi:hypothetical protein